MIFYCVKCRAKKDVGENYEKTTLKNGRPAVKATCPDCGTGMFKIVAAS
jgi:nitrate/TMAO reductase-like tetraheme cytochrome c subunit